MLTAFLVVVYKAQGYRRGIDLETFSGELHELDEGESLSSVSSLCLESGSTKQWLQMF